MIRRQRHDQFVLMGQHDHALLSGQLARYWGNSHFAPPVPWEAVCDACGWHDCGWTEHDAAPTLNARGLPLDVFEPPVLLALQAWSASVDRVQAKFGPYVALLVSLHGLGLSAFSAGNEHTRPEMFEINKFQHQQAERQESLRRQLGLRTDLPLRLGLARDGADVQEDALAYNYQVLQVVDRLSLSLLCQEVVFPQIQGVRSSPGGPTRCLSVSRPAEWELTVEPWPFEPPQLRLSINCRVLPATTFASDDEFRAAFAAAQPREQTLTLRPPSS
jgi:hypothetical protein